MPPLLDLPATPLLVHPQFDPIAFNIGPVGVHWYGLTYLAAFALFLVLANHRVKLSWWADKGWTRTDVDDLLFWGVLGVVLGGRIGYVLFYKPDYYVNHLLDVFRVWEGGMSFHGGMLGVIVAMAGFARVRGRRFLEVTDLIAPCVPTGLAAGRIGNFINGELWGRAAPADLPWAMLFPQAPDGGTLPRHPSEIYQFLGEGLLLFVLLWLYARKPRLTGQISAAFLFGYGVLRFAAEYFREPDDFLGYRALGWSQGQWLCVPMIGAGIVMWLWASRKKEA